MYISHSVIEGQRHNNPLNPRCFCLQRPKRDGTSSQLQWRQLKFQEAHLNQLRQRQELQGRCQSRGFFSHESDTNRTYFVIRLSQLVAFRVPADKRVVICEYQRNPRQSRFYRLTEQLNPPMVAHVGRCVACSISRGRALSVPIMFV